LLYNLLKIIPTPSFFDVLDKVLG